MLKTKKRVVEITEPVAKLQYGPNEWTSIYVLKDKNEKFRMPGVSDESPRAWDYGPSLIVEKVSPSHTETVTYDPNNKNIWSWINALIGIGSWAINNSDVSKQIPPELKSYWSR